jgi:hypothetical protein
MLDLTAIKARLEEWKRKKAGTTGTSWASSDERPFPGQIPDQSFFLPTTGQPILLTKEDKAFVAFAKNVPIEDDVEALLAEVERLMEQGNKIVLQQEGTTRN